VNLRKWNQRLLLQELRRVEGIQHLRVVERLPRGARASPYERVRVGKLRRNRPLKSLKAKCREVTVGIRRKASQVGELTNESRGETLLYFTKSSRGERTKEIFGRDFTKFRESLDILEVQGSYSVGVERIQSSGGVAPFIQAGQRRWIVHEIAYRDLMRKVS
jgi:hypothetical protein